MSPQQKAHGALMTISALADLIVQIHVVRDSSDSEAVSGITPFHDGAILAAIRSLAEDACTAIERAPATPEFPRTREAA